MSTFLSLKDKVNKQGVYLSILFIIILIFANAFLTYQYKKALNQDISNQNKYNEIKKNKDNILVNLNNIDMSIRGYLLVENEAFLGTLDKINGFHKEQFAALDVMLPQIGISASTYLEVKKKVDDYFHIMDEVVVLKKEGKVEEALKIIKEDHGTGVWETYMEFSKLLDPMLDKKKAESHASYNNLLTSSILFNLFLAVIGIPLLIYIYGVLRRNEKKRNQLYKELDENNRSLIFDNSESINLSDERTVIGGIINNLTKTAEFIKGLSQGNYEVNWEGMTEANEELNKNSISGELMMMKNQMKKRLEDTEKQKWIADGLTRLSEILRDNQDDFTAITEKTVSFVVKYLKAQQGALFAFTQPDGSKGYLELVSCYAYDRKKFLSKRVELGEGMIGQTFLEGEPCYLTKVPEKYFNIRSGLGDSTPKSLLIFPLKYNETTVAVLELASFKEFNNYDKQFLENACKTIASSLITIKTNEKTKLLLLKSQQQTEDLRSQEEEMRQNMEELEATQEEMKRKEIELRRLLENRTIGE